MNQAYPLDAVIREVSRDVEATADGERRIIIDLDLRRAVDRKRLLHDARYFIVTNTRGARKGAEHRTPLIAFNDFENDRKIAVQVVYLAACEPGREQQVAEALFDGPHPAAVLNEKIKRWLRDYAAQRPTEFVSQFFALQPQIQSYIRARAYEETGLNVSVRLCLDGDETVPDAVPIGPMKFAVRLQDNDEGQEVSVKGELRLDETNRINAVLYRRDQAALEQFVRQEVQNYFAETVSLHTFWVELNSDAVKQGLIRRLNGALRPFGRRVGYISVASEMVAGNIRSFFEDEICVECKIKEYPHPVVVNNTVQMVLRDLARYRANRSPDLLDWNQRKLQQVISERLLEKNCTDLLLTFPQVEQQIKAIMDREAEAIGYGFKQLIAVPNLEALNWLEPFTINLPGSFKTRDTRFDVNLEIAVTARIKDLRGIASYVNRGQHVPELMKKAILEKTAEYLHTVEPERYYIRFTSPDRRDVNTVEQELIDRISDTLTRQFNAEILLVTPKMGDTEITDKLRLLQEKVCPFQVEVFLPDTPALVPVYFKGAFKVESVDAEGWYKFQQLQYDMEEIKRHLEDYISSELDAYLRGVRAGRAEAADPEDLIKHLAQKCIREVYGLAISVSGVRRLHNELEEVVSQTQVNIYKQTLKAAETRVEALLSQLEIAEGALLTLIAEGGTNEEIIRQKEKISLLRSELPVSPAASGGKLKSLSASRISGRSSLMGPAENKQKRLAAGKHAPVEAKAEE